MSKGLLKSTFVFSSMTLLSRLMGFVRDMVFASAFGAVAGFDAFVVAYKLPNFMRRLFAEGAFSQAFVPVLSEYREKNSTPLVQQFVNNTAGALLSSLLLFTLVIEIIAPLVVMVFAPGFFHDPTQYTLAIQMVRITFPYLLLISMVAYSGAILNSFDAFAVPAFTPIILNVVLIVTAFWLAPLFHVPVIGLAWGVIIAGLLQLLFQVPFLYRQGLLPIPAWGWHDPGVRRVMKLMVPAIFGVSVAQISILVDTIFASFLAAGSISWLYYSQQLAFFPLGVFGVGLATVVLPHLSRKFTAKSEDEYNSALNWALRCVIVISLPATIGLVLLSGPLIAAMFLSGRFTPHDVVMTQHSLIAFALGVPGFMLVKVLAAGFYSRQQMKTPVKIAMVAFITNIVLNCLFIYPLQHAGLALATSLSSALNALLLLYQLRKSGFLTLDDRWFAYLSRVLLANLMMWAVLYFGVQSLSVWFEWTRTWRILSVLAWVGVGGFVYVACLALSGLRMADFKVDRLPLLKKETS